MPDFDLQGLTPAGAIDQKQSQYEGGGDEGVPSKMYMFGLTRGVGIYGGIFLGGYFSAEIRAQR